MSEKRCYFAYGSNMDLSQMRQRCPEAVFVNIAKLSGYRFIINNHGVATVIPKTVCNVYGITWNITSSDEELLDEYEGIKCGTYIKKNVDVKLDTKEIITALIYIARDSNIGYPRNGYKELRSWLQKGD